MKGSPVRVRVSASGQQTGQRAVMREATLTLGERDEESGMSDELVFSLSHAEIEVLAAKVADLIGFPGEPPPLSPYMTVPEAAEYMRAKPQRVYD
jgi:hypothetical protein